MGPLAIIRLSCHLPAETRGIASALADPPRLRTSPRRRGRGLLREDVPERPPARRAREARPARDGFRQDRGREGGLGAEPLRDRALADRSGAIRAGGALPDRRA